MWKPSLTEIYVESSWKPSLTEVYIEHSWKPSLTEVYVESSWKPSLTEVYIEHSWKPSLTEIYVEGCFPETELVQGNDSFIPIGSLKIGDKLISWDVEQKKAQYTAVTGIRRCVVFEIICFNSAMRCSPCHPLLVMESRENSILIPVWKSASDVTVGDCVVGSDGKFITIKSKSERWYNSGTEVITLSTDCGSPFFVGNYIVMADNSKDKVVRIDKSVTRKIAA